MRAMILTTLVLCCCCCLSPAPATAAYNSCYMNMSCYIGRAYSYGSCYDMCKMINDGCESTCEDPTTGPCKWECGSSCTGTPSQCSSWCTSCKANCKKSCGSECFWCTRDCEDRWCWDQLPIGGGGDPEEQFLRSLSQ